MVDWRGIFLSFLIGGYFGFILGFSIKTFIAIGLIYIVYKYGLEEGKLSKQKKKPKESDFILGKVKDMKKL